MSVQGSREDRDVTLRRTVQQVKHCVEEALSVIEGKEDLWCALDDLAQAGDLVKICQERIRRQLAAQARDER